MDCPHGHLTRTTTLQRTAELGYAAFSCMDCGRTFNERTGTLSHCGGALKIIAAIEEPAVIAKILAHLGLPTRAPPRSPARSFELIESR